MTRDEMQEYVSILEASNRALVEARDMYGRMVDALLVENKALREELDFADAMCARLEGGGRIRIVGTVEDGGVIVWERKQRRLLAFPDICRDAMETLVEEENLT